jgi:hypothetical protein
MAQSIKASKNIAEEQKDIQNQQAAVAAQKRNEEKRAAARRRRIAAASVAQSAENSGVGDSSAKEGTIGSLSTQFGATQAGINVREVAEKQIRQSQNRIADLNVDQEIAGGITSIGKSIFSYSMS